MNARVVLDEDRVVLAGRLVAGGVAMTRERWEVRAGERVWTFFGDDRAACRSACLALAGARRRLGLEARIVHVRTYRVEVVSPENYQ